MESPKKPVPEMLLLPASTAPNAEAFFLADEPLKRSVLRIVCFRGFVWWSKVVCEVIFSGSRVAYQAAVKAREISAGRDTKTKSVSV